jgi:hypothetical protein
MKYLVMGLILMVATSAFCLDKKAYQFREDFGVEGLNETALQYYYYIPCPTYNWFFAYSGWHVGDILGVYYSVGDQGTGGYAPYDPLNCHTLERIRVLDFAGYGTVYVGWYTFELDVWCPPCPLVHLWKSGPCETHFGWNYFDVIPPLCLTPCFDGEHLTFVVTATMTGAYEGYPAWGFDNIGDPVNRSCTMHDIGCLPATYPRMSVNSGYFGNGDYCQYDPPMMVKDGYDTTPDGSMYGFLELGWRVYLGCYGTTPAEATTWGNIKSMYR